MKKKLKIALVHDYLKEYGGAERVLEALHEIWPDAPVYTTVYLPKYLGPHRKRFEKWDVRTSWLQKIPFKAKLISPFRLIAPFIFKSWDFSKYDVVIVSATGAYNPNLIDKGSAKHICYCHTPPRYLYGYPTARDWRKNIFTRVLGEIANHILRMVDFKSAQNVDHFIANSKEVRARIKKFYRKDAVVINPPVDFTGVSREIHTGSGVGSHTGNKDYYVAGGRLARAKRVDLAVKACTKLKLPLKVFGKEFAGYGDELRELAGSTIEFLGEVTEEEKLKLMAGASAFIFPAELEDFGITPVEAMAIGTPVIAYRSGGVQETIIEGKTGLFFNKPTIASLISVIKQFNNLTIKPSDCIKQARKFSKERFVKEIQRFVNVKVKVRKSK
jgi:glycosyltransferase involved in cell wall biosynthesis